MESHLDGSFRYQIGPCRGTFYVANLIVSAKSIGAHSVYENCKGNSSETPLSFNEHHVRPSFERERELLSSLGVHCRFLGHADGVEALIQSLDKRGAREGPLNNNLLRYREALGKAGAPFLYVFALFDC